MTPQERFLATYELKPVDRLIRQEFYIWGEAIERWKQEGLPEDWQERNLFGFDPSPVLGTSIDLGWCEAPFVPRHEVRVVEERGPYEVEQDSAGRLVLFPKGIRHGVMPQYLKHVVTGWEDWKADVEPRLNPKDATRWAALADHAKQLRESGALEEGVVQQGFIGGYMHLRCLLGPEDLLYAFHDMPDLIHEVMRNWSELMDTAIAKVQEALPLRILYMAEDIAYKTAMLISPKTFREFLMPHYQQLVSNARARTTEKVYFNVDTDGAADQTIDLYLECGMTGMTPFEVAAGQDVVAIGRRYPELVMLGGIDKRVLAQGKREIDRMLDTIIPTMKARGGYIPHCDHGVPCDVSFENYMHYRTRIMELG